MIEIRLKRTGENTNCTFGELRIPKIKFGCRTLELRDGSNLMCKQSCRIDEGSYLADIKINKSGFFAPVIKYRVRGFAVKPKFDLFTSHFSDLLNGDIAIGIGYKDQFSIEANEEIRKAFHEACKKVWLENPSDTFILRVYKSAKNYQYYENDFFKETLGRDWNYLEEEEDAETE